MKNLPLILAAIVATGGNAAAPAVAGLAGNPSFSHQIPVPVPSQAQPPSFADDHGHGGVATTPVSKTTARPEPGDDHAGAAPPATHAEPGDDRGGATPHAEPSDDRGGDHGGRHHDGHG